MFVWFVGCPELVGNFERCWTHVNKVCYQQSNGKQKTPNRKYISPSSEQMISCACHIFQGAPTIQYPKNHPISVRASHSSHVQLTLVSPLWILESLLVNFSIPFRWEKNVVESPCANPRQGWVMCTISVLICWVQARGSGYYRGDL